MSDPNYSPKLKSAMEEIKAILHKHDIAGAIVLHTPQIIEGVRGTNGATEHYMFITPSYSAVQWTPLMDGVNILGHRKHYGGDTTLRNERLRDTTNMLNMLAITMGRQSLQLMELSKLADDTWDAQHGDGTDTPHQAPLN